MCNHHAEHEQAASRSQHLTVMTVADVMVRDPKTLHAAASVHDAVMELQDDHVHLVLLVDGERLVGTVARGDLPAAHAKPGARAADVATLAGRTVSASMTAAEAAARLRLTSGRRLAVVDSDNRLLGLLCLKRTGRGFCSDDDVAARRRAHSHHDD